MSKYMYDRLRTLNVPASLTRSTDETLIPTDRIKRIKELGDIKGNVLVSNHLNSGSSSADGAEVIYALRSTNTLPNLILNELSKEGQNIRTAYQRRLPNNTSQDYYYIMRDTTNLEPVLVEYGFVTSDGDDPSQLKSSWEDFAEATVRALSQYVGFKYSPPTFGKTYTVQKGDSLYSIAQKNGTTVQALIEANNITTSTVLQIGQILKLPGEIVPEPTPTPTEYTIYTVQKGDSLYGIANKFGVPYTAIIDLNNLKTTNLFIGQELLIPTKSTNTIEYYVQKGDSLYSIANKFDTSIDTIKSMNKLTSNTLQVGQMLVIPTSQSIPAPTEPDYTVYIVLPGDSLYSISKKFNTSVEELVSLNGLQSVALKIGQKLLIPNTYTGYITYTVQKGDSLYNIATKFNTTVDQIKQLNQLSSNTLQIGQQLLIPA